ncbi:hypothetical protein AKJ09_04537 [Labilithrix luteola]|uniref:Type IV fimbrial biogenesis protein PilY1 n=1 Tax=Labilithrix luteola TaxID=1391654 RepID=A0A0K1PWG9_9BACT|nr:hypothetical protein [Labilithrix luteola]AKU97873.1 hypothetical protein AKJ09_04537 [Labilithrix luteola]
MKSTRTLGRWFLFVCPSLGIGMACATADQNGAAVVGGEDASYVIENDAQADVNADAECDGGDACAPVACESEDFCVVPNAITPQIAVNAISGTAPDDVWFAGTHGTLLHYDGKELRAIDTKLPNALIAVWGVERNAAWAVPLNGAPLRVTLNAAGESEVAPVPGDVWPGKTEKIGRARAIGGSKDAVWLVGDPADYPDDWILNQNIRQLVIDEDGGTTWRSPLTGCTPFATCGPRLRAICSFGATSAWAMGIGGGFRLEPNADAGGVVWTPYDLPLMTTFEGVWGTHADDVWAVGANGAIIHFGAAGEPRWEIQAPVVPVNLHGIWGSAKGDIWVVGDRGQVLHYDGTNWGLGESGLPPIRREADLYAVWGSGPDDVWIGGNGVLLHRSKQNRRRP